MEDQNAEPDDDRQLRISFPAEFVVELFRRLDRMQTPVIQWNADQQVMNVAAIESLKSDAQNLSQKIAEACHHKTPAEAVDRLMESVDRCREHNAILRR